MTIPILDHPEMFSDTPLQTLDDVRRARERLYDLLFRMLREVAPEDRLDIAQAACEVLRDADLSVRRALKAQKRRKVTA